MTLPDIPGWWLTVRPIHFPSASSSRNTPPGAPRYLIGHASEVLHVSSTCALAELRDWLVSRDDKYRQLALAKANPLTLPSVVDAMERECCDCDRPLKRLLHKMEGSAVCLSGGGIRSASFGLGVLEGLARFSLGLISPAQEGARSADRNPAGLLQGLDYLSTVSGGGYIGSWLTAWIDRRRTAEVQGARANLKARAAELKRAKAALEATTEKPDARTVASTAAASSGSSATVDTMEGTQAAKQAKERFENAKAAFDGAECQFSEAHAATWEPSYRQVVKALAGDSDFTSGDPRLSRSGIFANTRRIWHQLWD